MEGAGLQIERINQAMSPAFDIVFFRRILFGKGNEDHALNHFNVERSITGGRIRVRELHQDQVGTVGVDGAFGKVSRQQNGTVGSGHEGNAFVNRAGADCQNFGIGSQLAAPAGNGAVFTGEDENVVVESAGVVEEHASG